MSIELPISDLPVTLMLGAQIVAMFGFLPQGRGRQHPFGEVGYGESLLSST